VTVAVSQANQSISALAQDIIGAALLEAGIRAPEDSTKLSGQDGAWGLQKLQRLIDQWNARRELIYSISFLQFTLIGNHAPHTIGPNGDFNVPIRPVDVKAAMFILSGTSTNPVDAPIFMKDADWWASNPVKTLQSAITTHLYYDPSSPLGTLNFWPICTVANPVRLEIWNSIQQAISLQTALSMPQGYWEALVLSLAVKICPSYNRSVPPDLRESWNEAMRTIEENNYAPPQLDLDIGIPNSRKGGRPDFNFLTGLRE
jgi:hypothetical protein